MKSNTPPNLPLPPEEGVSAVADAEILGAINGFVRNAVSEGVWVVFTNLGIAFVVGRRSIGLLLYCCGKMELERMAPAGALRCRRCGLAAGQSGLHEVRQNDFTPEVLEAWLRDFLEDQDRFPGPLETFLLADELRDGLHYWLLAQDFTSALGRPS